MDLILRGGTVVTAADTYDADIGIEKGRIARLGFDLGPARREIDVSGLYLLPGAVDVHTHVDVEFQGLQSVEDFHSGTVAAACGGVTTLIDYALPGPGETPLETIETWHAKARDKAVIDYGFHVAVFEPDDAAIQQIPDVIADGHTSFKIFMMGTFEQYIDGFMQMMAQVGRHGGSINLHVEDACCLEYLARRFNADGKYGAAYFADSRPRASEGIAAMRGIGLAQVAEVPAYLVHLSCEESLESLAKARAKGQTVYGETRPCYLHFSREKMEEENGILYAGWPPLREADQMEILWQGLESGVLQTVATDHDGWSFQQKKSFERVDEILAGMAGLETMVPLLYSQGVLKKRLSLNRMVEVTATNPARLFGLYPRKGAIQVGADADIVAFDPRARKTIRAEDMHSAADWDPFEGWEVEGWPRMTLSRGEVVVDRGQVLARPGRGRLLKRDRFSETVARL
ncbi:MAG: dihydropyrimidinase [Rhodospirillaceae bacterium]|nr:dihydropyrimidinase [Rhodospirillaceae bacterium]